MKTFEEAVGNAARVLETAEKHAEKGDPERARELLGVAARWESLAHLIDDHERRR